jgi:hypothetical protein
VQNPCFSSDFTAAVRDTSISMLQKRGEEVMGNHESTNSCSRKQRRRHRKRTDQGSGCVRRSRQASTLEPPSTSPPPSNYQHSTANSSINYISNSCLNVTDIIVNPCIVPPGLEGNWKGSASSTQSDQQSSRASRFVRGSNGSEPCLGPASSARVPPARSTQPQ